MIAAYAAMLTTAMVYGNLIEAAFDLHRWKLYEALRWPTPTTPADERAAGAKLTQYIWRGSDDDTPVFDVATPNTAETRKRPMMVRRR